MFLKDLVYDLTDKEILIKQIYEFFKINLMQKHNNITLQKLIK